jgi:hypothetical protein
VRMVVIAYGHYGKMVIMTSMAGSNGQGRRMRSHTTCICILPSALGAGLSCVKQGIVLTFIHFILHVVI